MGAAWLNLALWFAFEFWRVDAVPDWVRRLVLSCAFGFGTWAGLMAITELGYDDADPRERLRHPLTLAARDDRDHACMRCAGATDIYPLAVVMGTFIIVSLMWLAQLNGFPAMKGMLLMLALWLIGTSTAAGRVLTALNRRWRAEARHERSSDRTSIGSAARAAE